MRSKSFQIILFSACLMLLINKQVVGQTTLINPSLEGGFDLGPDFSSNGWTVVNGINTTKWFVGTAASGFTQNAAYVSKDAGGSTWSMSGNTFVHFYRDVTFPAGETIINLSFSWQSLGSEYTYSGLVVSVAPTSYVPTTSSITFGEAFVLNLPLFSGNLVQQANINIPASVINNCSASSTMRLIFTWVNTGGSGPNPPAAIDNISLVSQNPATTSGRITNAGGMFTIDNTLPNSGTNFTTFTEAINSINRISTFCSPMAGPITFSVAANQTFTEIVPRLTATGTALNQIIFQKAGTGDNPKIVRNDIGTFRTSSMGGVGDAVITIDGSDYVTFNQIDVAASNDKIEYGYLLVRASSTDGCKNVTIKNADISMTRGDRTLVAGIYSSPHSIALSTGGSTGIPITSQGGQVENLVITGNNITNVFHGIMLIGPETTSFYDQNAVVGANGFGNGNTITNFGGPNTYGEQMYGIYTRQQNTISITYNSINNLLNGGISGSGWLYGINVEGSAHGSPVTINNNKIKLGSTLSALYGIFNSAGGFTGDLTIDSNTVSLNYNGGNFISNENSMSANSKVSISNNLFDSSQLIGFTLIKNSIRSNARVNVKNNRNVGFKSNGSGNGNSYGYYSNADPTGIENFTGNNFSNIELLGTINFYGYYSKTLSVHNPFKRNLSGNTISNIFTGGATVRGIYTEGEDASNIYQNKISGLTSTATNATVHGISTTKCAKDSIYNNVIGGLYAPASSISDAAVAGIYSSSTLANSSIGIYYNTIFLDASSGGVNFGTAGIYLASSATATTAAVEMKNNLVANNSIPLGTGKTSVLRRSGTSLANWANTSNNNLYFTIAPGAATALYYDGINADYILPDLQSRAYPRESISICEMPIFASLTPDDLAYLHINWTIPSQIDGGGAVIPGIETDFDGDLRNSVSPDIGADEFTYTLPVTLLSFTGEKQNSINKLQWTTTTEVNNAGFELERSADGKNFSKLAFVASKADGNSSQTLNYVYYDERPLMGNGYYRLKQVDKDGKFTYSNIVLIKGSKVKEIMITSVYPNPADRELNLIITSPTSEKVTLVVTDMTGKVISQTYMQVSAGDNLQKLQVNQLESGTYFIKTICAVGCESQVQKFVKQ